MPGPTPAPGGGTPAPTVPGGTPAAGAASLGGSVVDFQTGQGVANLTVQCGGKQAVTGQGGTFQIAGVTTGQPVGVAVTGADYASSVQAMTIPAAGITTAKVVAIKNADLAARYQAAQAAQQPGMGTVAISLLRGQGGGRENVPLQLVTLTPAVAGLQPRAFNAQNQPSQVTVLDAQQRALVWYFNVPVGNYQVSATYPNDNDGAAGGGTGGGTGVGTGVGTGGGTGGGAGTGTVPGAGGGAKMASFAVAGPGLTFVEVNRTAAAGYYDDSYGDSNIFGGCSAGGASSLGSLALALGALLVSRRRARARRLVA